MASCAFLALSANISELLCSSSSSSSSAAILDSRRRFSSTITVLHKTKLSYKYLNEICRSSDATKLTLCSRYCWFLLAVLRVHFRRLFEHVRTRQDLRLIAPIPLLAIWFCVLLLWPTLLIPPAMHAPLQLLWWLLWFVPKWGQHDKFLIQRQNNDKPKRRFN